MLHLVFLYVQIRHEQCTLVGFINISGKEKNPLWFYIPSYHPMPYMELTGYNVVECLQLCQHSSPDVCSVGFERNSRKSQCRLSNPYANRYSPVGVMQLAGPDTSWEYWEVVSGGTVLNKYIFILINATYICPTK